MFDVILVLVDENEVSIDRKRLASVPIQLLYCIVDRPEEDQRAS
ncbi:Hypothetical Protein RSKD131_0343 [Cereibacter sphaeroides KD131]|nr:Hypothetical Protein RSKD131_0343 [Cereibacter sphaeroides KD131]